MALGKSFKNIIVKPLLKGSILASVLDYLLSNDTTKEGSHRGDGGSSELAGVSHNALLKLLDMKTFSRLVAFKNLLDMLKNNVSIFFAFRESSVGSLEIKDTVHSKMELLGSSEVSEIGGLEHTVLG